jgi:hypothetical protein
MRVALAERLLIKIMDWTTDEVMRERPLLQNLANFKYDEYQQFSPGIRFIESLVLWLKQFESVAERKVAYSFFKSSLIFISNAEMYHLVSLAFPDFINLILIKKAATEIPCSPYAVRNIGESNEYKRALHKSLFIGLSDGSRIDQFRRSGRINNEQVSTTYHISKAKAEEMLKELNERLANEKTSTSSEADEKFNSLFLIDDFTASGVSYFKPDEGKGKIYKCLNTLFGDTESGQSSIEQKENYLGSMVDISKLQVHVLFYVATEESLSNLRVKIDEWFKLKSLKLKCSVEAVQVINSNVKNDVLVNADMIDIAKKYFNKDIVNRHFRKGKHDSPHLGFNECSLPLVLSHNTPNNSLPILWFPEDMNPRGLFPRISRHK